MRRPQKAISKPTFEFIIEILNSKNANRPARVVTLSAEVLRQKCLTYPFLHFALYC